MRYDAKKYKQAKLLVADIKNILNSINENLPFYLKHRKYQPVKAIINELVNARNLLKVHLETQTKIVNNKGKIDEE